MPRFIGAFFPPTEDVSMRLALTFTLIHTFAHAAAITTISGKIGVTEFGP